ncbi:hypothetical protein CQ012_02460 [Arthrobacter sp. MYb214]|uniref:hypothetical protein n=1 Tax=Arthrobacter sp. MYb214 TaxID=1848596 RepID=UPI000CFDB2B1|nr:hypothetical protein [Arthrobacter sp. MYb214]PRB78271.1 hypothetical protein CQ012_02460 [Arthrobacter sp. MYb214]
MAIGIRIEFEHNPDSDDKATIGDLRRWLAIVDRNGVDDDEELLPLFEGHYNKMTESSELSGFFVYGSPSAQNGLQS